MQLFLLILRDLRDSLRGIHPLHDRCIHVQQEDGTDGCGARFPGTHNNCSRRSDDVILLSHLRPRSTRKSSYRHERELSHKLNG